MAVLAESAVLPELEVQLPRRGSGLRHHAERSRDHHYLRLRRLLLELTHDLPGDWAVRGGPSELKLVREPIEWAVEWVGYRPTKKPGQGWLYASVQPLMDPHPVWSLDYGMRLRPRRGIRMPIDLASADAVYIAQDCVRTALPSVVSWTPEHLAASAERDYLEPRGERPTQWRFLPGWRVILDGGSPVEPAERLRAYYERKAESRNENEGSLRQAADLCRRVIAAWENDGRAEALEVLAAHRDDTLTRWNLTTPCS